MRFVISALFLDLVDQFKCRKMGRQEKTLKWILEQLGKLAKFLTSLKSS